MEADEFKHIFVPFHQKLYRIAYRFLEDTDLASDMVQEVYSKLWTQKAKLAAIQNKEAYAVTVLRNLCLDQLKKTKNLVSLEQQVHNKAVEEIPDWSEETTVIRKILNTLPEQQRTAFWLKHWEEYSNEEIEEQLGISAVNLRVCLSRARKTIKEQFLKWRKG